jgi:hypothetical protein
MEGFPNLPVEVARLILNEAVRVRSLKRAVRLRFVSHMWNVEIMEAIIRCEILDNYHGQYLSVFWPQYLVHKIFSKEASRSQYFCILREVLSACWSSVESLLLMMQ